MSVALVFPGQGAPTPGMLHELPAGSEDLLAVASDVLGEPAVELDSAAKLQSTRAVQLALLLTGVAWARAACSAGLEVAFVAGHSVGLWAAAVTADAIDLRDAVRAVDVRGTAMAAASPAGAGMLAVEGLPVGAVAAVLRRARAAEAQVWLTNVNSETQTTVSGLSDGLAAATAMLNEAGARGVERLQVSVAAHSPLMLAAGEAVGAVLLDVRIRPPRVPVAGNVDGRTLFTADDLRRDLVDSISCGVQWARATAVLAERGVDVWVQIPPRDELLRLVPGDGERVAIASTGVAEAVRRARRRACRRCAGRPC